MEKDLQNIIQDTFDKLTWEDLRKKSDVLTQRVIEGQEYSDLFPQLSQDIFAALYKGEPTLKEECPFGTEVNRQHVECLMESEQYDSIRAYTMFDDFSSALACSDVMSSVIEEFKKKNTYSFTSYSAYSEGTEYSTGTATATGNFKTLNSEECMQIVVLTNPGELTWVGKTFYVPMELETGQARYPLYDAAGNQVNVWVSITE